MWKLNDIISIKYVDNYTYHIEFDDGVEGDIDFSKYLDKGVVFAPLKDKRCFQSAHVEGGTICWSNGADVSPETLYDLLSSKR